MNHIFPAQNRANAGGFALVVAILLLLILTVFSLFAVNVGVFETRASGNEFRSKAVQQVAEAALNHGVAALRVRMNAITPLPGQGVSNALWELCQRDDLTFPCGAEPDPARRALSYRFVGGIDVNGGGIDKFERHSLVLPPVVGRSSRQIVTSIPSAASSAPFPVTYTVGALLCRIDKTADPAAGDESCTTIAADTGKLNAFTLVARAEMTGENSTATVSRVVAPVRRAGLNPHLPAVTASGVLQGVGNGLIVPNPNAGGPGVEVSFWTPLDFDYDNGSYVTCKRGDWLRSSEIEMFEGSPICSSVNGPSCQCGTAQISSGADHGSATEGADVLDVDGNDGANLDSDYFPCDLMEFVFGDVRAREDLDGDGHCETGTDSDGDGEIDAVIDYLQSFERLETQGEVNTKLGTADPENSRYWVDCDCTLPGTRIGSPNSPVVIVVDGPLKYSSRSEIFGVIFARDPALVYERGHGVADLPSGRGNATIYGALVAEGDAKINGSVNIIFDANSLNPEDPSSDPDTGDLPGSWTDRLSY